ncbi:unnamed protein product [Urochloa humidicola]
MVECSSRERDAAPVLLFTLGLNRCTSAGSNSASSSQGSPPKTRRREPLRWLPTETLHAPARHSEDGSVSEGAIRHRIDLARTKQQHTRLHRPTIPSAALHFTSHRRQRRSMKQVG